MKKTKHPMKWIIWSLAAFFYFYEFFLRVAPSVMIPELMSAFNVNATAVGFLTAFYFYIYSPMQLPVGILTDRYGARKLLAIAAFVAGLGSILFSISSYFWIACLGRLMIGGGSAFGFVGLIYICSHWFDEKKRGIMLGLGSSIGMLGAVAGQGPLRGLIDVFGWRASNIQLGFLGILLAVILFFVVRNDPPEMARYDKMVKKEPNHLLANLKVVCKNGYSWLNSVASLFLYLATPGFAGLWGIPFVHTLYGISIELSGYAVSMFFIGWAFGGPIIGMISDKLHQKKSVLILGSLLGAIIMGVVVYVPNLSLLMLFLLFFLAGFFSGTQLLNYNYSIDINPDRVKATAAAFVNFIVVIGCALIQPFVGYLLDANWTGQMEKGIRIYPPEAYKIAMSCFPIAFLISFVLSFFLKKIPPKTIWQKLFIH